MHFLPPDKMRLHVSFTPLAGIGARFIRELNDPVTVAMALFSLTFFPHSIGFGNIPILKGAEMIEHSSVTPLHMWPCSLHLCSHLTSPVSVPLWPCSASMPQLRAKLSPGPLRVYHFPILLLKQGVLLLKCATMINTEIKICRRNVITKVKEKGNVKSWKLLIQNLVGADSSRCSNEKLMNHYPAKYRMNSRQRIE